MRVEDEGRGWGPRMKIEVEGERDGGGRIIKYINKNERDRANKKFKDSSEKRFWSPKKIILLNPLKKF